MGTIQGQRSGHSSAQPIGLGIGIERCLKTQRTATRTDAKRQSQPFRPPIIASPNPSPMGWAKELQDLRPQELPAPQNVEPKPSHPHLP